MSSTLKVVVVLAVVFGILEGLALLLWVQDRKLGNMHLASDDARRRARRSAIVLVPLLLACAGVLIYLFARVLR